MRTTLVAIAMLVQAVFGAAWRWHDGCVSEPAVPAWVACACCEPGAGANCGCGCDAAPTERESRESPAPAWTGKTGFVPVLLVPRTVVLSAAPSAAAVLTRASQRVGVPRAGACVQAALCVWLT